MKIAILLSWTVFFYIMLVTGRTWPGTFIGPDKMIDKENFKLTHDEMSGIKVFIFGFITILILG